VDFSQIAPWDDEPEPPRAPVAAPYSPPAVPPAVLRGRDDIRRRAEPIPGEEDARRHESDDLADDDVGDDEDRGRGIMPTRPCAASMRSRPSP
jgi:hypothetical protein